MNKLVEHYDVAVIGAGHAGCEAALAAARLGMETIVFTVSVDSIALMPCNPNIGGSSKGHLVREIDALGGEMGKVIDKTFIQSKMLNKSKGPAVHSLRAQADKKNYSNTMRQVLENQENLTIKQAEVTDLIVEEGIIKGVKTYSGATYLCKAVVLCTGTYLKARCIYGDISNYTGPNGLQAANYLTDSLKKNGVEMFRFKTGTPARIDKRTIDFSKMEEQKGDERVVPFSFSTDPESVQIDQASCWLTYTNEKTHEIIRANLDRSPLYSGMIEGTGPRYCPSIEDKVVKFSDKPRHQVFIEPEGLGTNEMYVGGMSSSLPEDVQHDMYHSVPGLEHAKIVRNAYAIEYDCINPRQLQATLEFKNIKNLFSGGQFNGSSGYEEAAAQGLVAGINAAMKILGKEMLLLDRSEAYIGVLIDDLVTKDNREPYRMMTSRAEYRLLLRQDNADLREKAQKTVGIFACFGDECIRIPYTKITADCRKNAAHRDGRIHSAFQQYMRSHRSCGGLTVSSGDRDRDLIICHNLPQKICAGHHGDPFFFCTGIFRVVQMNSSSIYDQINAINNIGSTLSVENLRSVGCQMISKFTFLRIRTGNSETFFKKNLGQTAHADTADAYKVNMNRFMKINGIHR